MESVCWVNIITVQIIMMLMLINIKLNVKHHYDFEEIRARLSL